MEKIIIRQALINDVDDIRGLTKELYFKIKNKSGLHLDRIEDNIKFILSNPEHYLLVATLRGKILGYVNFSARKTILHPTYSIIIDELIVTHKYENRGIGKSLIYAVMDKCKQLKCSEIEVSTEKSNSKAIEFYKNLGFDEKGLIFEKDL